jgi:amidase
MLRREFLQFIGGSIAISVQAAKGKASPVWDDAFKLSEFTIPQLQRGLVEGKWTAASLAKAYLRRIERLDQDGPRVNSVIEVNPDALELARELDRERRNGDVRGPMHGIPILVKDNIDTGDRMTTTAGSLALQGTKALRDAFLVKRLRAAGAVILGKTNLSEWANFRSNRSTSGWSARGGLTRNPYVLDRNTSGSSSGSGAAVAANFCAAAVGTETDGSIISPSTYCGIVGLKPTVGLVSRSGIVPISKSQDTAGPMTRTVEDAAILLSAMAGFDSSDQITKESLEKKRRDYTEFLDMDGLRGTRIGIVRQLFANRNERVAEVVEMAIGIMKAAGAEVIDKVEMPSLRQIGDAEFQVLLYEFKAGIQEYLATRGENFRLKTLADLIQFNQENKDRELRYFGQETFLRAQEKGPLTDKAYLEAREKCVKLTRAEGIDAVMDEHRLDALFAPSGAPAHRTDLIYGDRGTGGSSSDAAAAGYPNITVPAGFVSGLPLGISFFGRAYSEPTLLKIAYGFEQASRARRSPQFVETIEEP